MEKITVPKEMKMAEFQTFVLAAAEKEGLDVTMPFPFLLTGDILDFKAHVLAAPKPASAGNAGHGAGAIQFDFSGNASQGRLLGFYSAAKLSGVISHPGEMFHVHMLDQAETTSSHVDSYSVSQHAQLSLPVAAIKLTRQEVVAERGTTVMPFSLSATTHIFSKTKMGGNQQVVAKSASDTKQVALIREHLREIEQHFAKGNFSSPAAIHGVEMPGLATLQQAKPGEIKVRYHQLSNGAELQFSSNKPALRDALHQWFDAQLADHGKDAMAGHAHHH